MENSRIHIPNEKENEPIKMKQNIKLIDIFGTDLFSRAKASELNAIIIHNANEVSLDFYGINFMSRSFTDELFNIIVANGDKTFNFLNCNETTKAILKSVSEGREHERKLGLPHPKMYKFENQKQLVDFLIAQ